MDFQLMSQKISSTRVRVVTNAALEYLRQGVNQSIRDHYAGKTEDTKIISEKRIRVSVTLTHDCGTRLIESVSLPNEVQRQKAQDKGVELAKKLIARIHSHGHTCDVVKIVPPVIESRKHDTVVYDSPPHLTIVKKPKPKVCKICGEQDTTKYPKWPECKHDRQDAATSGKESVEDKRTTKKKPRPKKPYATAAKRLRRPKDRAAKRQGPVDGPRHRTAVEQKALRG